MGSQLGQVFNYHKRIFFLLNFNFFFLDKRRDSTSLINPKKLKSKDDLSLINTDNKEDKTDKVSDDSNVNKNSKKASRHIFLIRHGKYEIHERDSEKQVLTMLGY